MDIPSQGVLTGDRASPNGRLAYAARLLVVGLAIGLLVHLDSLARRLQETPQKVAVPIASSRTELGDNYYYFMMAKYALQRFHGNPIRSTDPDGGDHRTSNAISNAYFAALLATHALYWVADAVTPSSRAAVLVTLVLNSSLLAAAFLLAVTVLLDIRPHLLALFCIGFVGIVCFDVFNISAYLAHFYAGKPAFTYYSNVTRLVNPTLFWAAGLALVSCVALLTRERGAFVFGLGMILGVTVGLFNVSVAGTLGFAFGLLAIAMAVTDRAASWRVFAVAVSLGLALLWSMGQLYLFRQTQMGTELQTGAFLGLQLRWRYLTLLVLSLPALILFPGSTRILLITLVTASAAVGTVSESFELGDRLWLRGASMFAWLVAVTVGVRAVAILSKRAPFRRFAAGFGRSQKHAVAVLGTLLFLGAAVGFVYWKKAPDPALWTGYIERDKWEVLQWLDHHAPANAIVASTSIEDSYLLPIYTDTKPVFALYGTTNRGVGNEVVRYWYATEVFGRSNERIQDVFAVTDSDLADQAALLMAGSPERLDDRAYQASAFFTSLLYYPYNKRFAGVLADGTGRDSLKDFLNSVLEVETKRNYEFDFALAVRTQPTPQLLKNWKVAYENRTYQLLVR